MPNRMRTGDATLPTDQASPIIVPISRLRRCARNVSHSSGQVETVV